MLESEVDICVSPRLLRCIFNTNSYAELVQHGVYSTRVRKSRPASASFLPPNSLSEGIFCSDEADQQVAYIHRFRQPDQRLGASGRPDPKWIRIGEVRFILPSTTRPAQFSKPDEESA